jgi:hypothetical protein
MILNYDMLDYPTGPSYLEIYNAAKVDLSELIYHEVSWSHVHDFKNVIQNYKTNLDENKRKLKGFNDNTNMNIENNDNNEKKLESNFGDLYLYNRQNSLFSITPKRGLALIFNHDVMHEGEMVISGTKYIMRTEIVFESMLLLLFII